MNDNTDVLFYNSSFFNVMEGQFEKAEKAVANYDGNKLLNTPTHDLQSYIVGEYRFEIPALHVEEANVDQIEAPVEVYNQFATFRGGSETFMVSGTKVIFTLPFSGDEGFFRIRPNTFSSSLPRCKITRESLIFTVAGSDMTQSQVKSAIDQFVASVQQHLNWQKTSADDFNSQLPGRIKESIEARKRKLLANQNLVVGLGFAMKERSNSPKTYAAPQIKRKIESRPPPASSAPYKPEPVLDE